MTCGALPVCGEGLREIAAGVATIGHLIFVTGSVDVTL